MDDFLKKYILQGKARINMDVPMSLEELAVLAELLGKFSSKCGSIGDTLKVSAVLAMVVAAAAAAREVKKDV